MVKLEENKIYTEHFSIEKLPPPKQVYLPLIQHIGKMPQPTVKVGDEVFLGQQIATSDATVSSPVHASVSGKVITIGNWPHPNVGVCKTIVLENDNKERLSSQPSLSEEGVKRLTSEEIRRIVRQAGIVGMGGAGFPTHIKLTPPKPVDTLILNGAESEPYLTSDYRLMVEKTKEIIEAVKIIVRCLGIRNVLIAIEDNKPQAIETFRQLLDLEKIKDYKLKILKSYYPQGGERQLIKYILKKEVPSGKLPFDVGVLVHNVGTLLAIYEAVYKNKPLYERVVTVTGDCLAGPKNLIVRIGSPIKDLIEFCQPFKKPTKIIIGGPMMGVAQYSTNAPIIKTSTSVILLSSKEVQVYKEDPCIRCGECVRNCPVGIQPCMISLAAERNNWQLAKLYSPFDCIECGLCAYLCPAKRNLVQSIKYAKTEVK